MSTHRVLHSLYSAPFLIDDPGNGSTIVVDRDRAEVPMKSGSSGETRTLPVPTKAGLECKLVLDTDGGGDITVTVTSGYNQAGSTTIVFGDAGDWVKFGSVRIGTDFRWRVLAHEGTNLIETGGGTISTQTISALTATAFNYNAGVTVTAVETSGAAIPDGGMLQMVTVTSANANYIVILPTPTPGTIVILRNGATGYELRSSAPATVAINGGAASNAESAIAASTMVIAVCTSATTWQAIGIAGATLAAVEAAAP
jgi:hypothetical protein